MFKHCIFAYNYWLYCCMNKQTNKRKPWLKRISITILLIVIILAGVYWYVATEKFSDTKDRKEAYTVNAIDLIHEFKKDDSAANTKYREKIITVSGRVSALESPDTSAVNVKFIDTDGSFLIFAFQDTHLAEGKTLAVGDSISIKASCSGGRYDSIIEGYKIEFKRAVLNK